MRTDRRLVVAVDDQRFDAKCFCVKPLPDTAPVLHERSYGALGATAADDDGVSASGAGGGLTVIASAPNPAGWVILRGCFDQGRYQPARAVRRRAADLAGGNRRVPAALKPTARRPAAGACAVETAGASAILEAR